MIYDIEQLEKLVADTIREVSAVAEHEGIQQRYDLLAPYDQAVVGLLINMFHRCTRDQLLSVMQRIIVLFWVSPTTEVQLMGRAIAIACLKLVRDYAMDILKDEMVIERERKQIDEEELQRIEAEWTRLFSSDTDTLQIAAQILGSFFQKFMDEENARRTLQ